jgi:hypothetical protein
VNDCDWIEICTLSLVSTEGIISLYTLYVICNRTIKFEDFTAVTLKITALWKVTSYSLVMYICTSVPSEFYDPPTKRAT